MAVADTRQRVRVVLVDQSDFVLRRLKRALTKNRQMIVVGTARTDGEASGLLRTCRPDVVVLDSPVGDGSGLHLCRTIRTSYPQTNVLFFTANDDVRFLRSAILAGAQGYLLKGVSDEAVAKVITIVAAGHAIVDPQLTSELLNWICECNRFVSRARLSLCSASDMRVLSLLAAGKSDTEMACQLGLTPGAFRVRLRGIYKQLEISRRSEAASYFARWEHAVLRDVI